MKNIDFVEIVLCLCFIFTCLVSIMIWMTIAKDLRDKVSVLEQENIELKWQLEQVDQMICVNE